MQSNAGTYRGKNKKKVNKKPNKNLALPTTELSSSRSSKLWTLIETLSTKIVLSALVFIAIYISHRYLDANFFPRDINLPAPPILNGPLAPNNWLKSADFLLQGRIKGPESILVEGDTIYTGTYDGLVVKIVKGQVVNSIRLNADYYERDDVECGTFEHEKFCGRPLGIRRLNSTAIVVADAYWGVFAIDFDKGKFSGLVELSNWHFLEEPGMPSFFNDLDILDERLIFFTDSSYKWSRRTFLHPLLEQEFSGRLFKYDIQTGKLVTLYSQLIFPNGVQIHPDRESVLVAECGRARVLRYYFAGTKNGSVEVFMDNLPGLPDNLRLSFDGKHLYVALAGVRHADRPSLLDRLAFHPNFVRALIATIPSNKFLGRAFSWIRPRHGMFLVADPQTGEILDSFHDINGPIEDVSQVSDDKDFYYLGSFHADFIARVPKRKLS